MAEWGDDDFYGAQCEMDDQMKIRETDADPIDFHWFHEFF